MKCLSIWMATAMALLRAYGQTSQTTAVQGNSQTRTYLYGRQASKLEGDIKKRGGDNFAKLTQHAPAVASAEVQREAQRRTEQVIQEGRILNPTVQSSFKFSIN